MFARLARRERHARLPRARGACSPALYPVVVLSSFRAAAVTKSSRSGGAHARVRQALVVFQFAMLIALLIATTVTYRQMALGMREALRQNTDPIVVAEATVHAIAAKRDAPRSTACATSRARSVCRSRVSNTERRSLRPGARPLPVRYLGLGLRILRALRIPARGRSILLRRTRHGRLAAQQRLDAPGSRSW